MSNREKFYEVDLQALRESIETEMSEMYSEAETDEATYEGDEYAYEADSQEEVDEMEGSMELPPHQVNLYHQMLSKGETDSEKIQLLLKENGFDFLAGRDVFFRCNCSHKRMIQNLHLYQQNDPQPLFDESQTSLSVTCEYCKKEYQITAEDLNQNPYVVN